METIPEHFKKGVIVNIPKSGKDKTIKDNNRGITLLSVIYKLFEKILISREDSFLHDNQIIDDIQSAGQRKCSSLHSSLLVQETVVHLLNKGSAVYTAFLDTRKAFDTVWVNGLLYKLHKSGMNKKTWRLLEKCYSGFQCTVMVNGQRGEWFKTERGVHQGAPFSMWLYMIFLNDLISALRASGYGASICHIPAASPCHADDVALIALYKQALNKLLEICVQYSKLWRYNYNMSKTVCLTWGKDLDPGVKLIMDKQILESKPSCKHVGITLCTDSQLTTLDCRTRGNAARAVLLAARGLGSAQVPVPPTTLSKLYWTVAIPKMTYGLDVTPMSDSNIEVLESIHRQNSKIAQGLPMNIPTPAPLATIGWLSIRSFISMIKIMFIFRTLCLPFHNVYRRVMIAKLLECAAGTTSKYQSPIMDMYKHAVRYGFEKRIMDSIQNNVVGQIEHWKVLVKKVIWKTEIVKWRASCMMYRELHVYNSCVLQIEMHAWWSVLKLRPYFKKHVASVMATSF